MLEMMLLIVAIFGAGFASGFAVRNYISHQRHRRARERDSGLFAARINPVSDAPFMSPAMPEIPIATPQSKALNATTTAPRQRAR